MQYLIIILDESANSFCYYPNPNREAKLINLSLLKKAIFYAQKNGLSINFLLGKAKLPKEYLKEIDKVSHIFIMSQNHISDDVFDVFVSDLTLDDNLSETHSNSDSNIILRIDKSQIAELSSKVIALTGKFKRINITIQNIDLFTQKDFDIYAQELEKLSEVFENKINIIGDEECNVLSDRIVLEKMNNCDAGVKHITLAPNGKFYICPAFYYEDDNNSVGDLQNGINVKNQQLYHLSYAPICRVCDAYQCKRCVWLNRKTTLEVNTPSHEQCVVSHLERNTSKKMLIKIQKRGLQVQANEIPDIDYLDPFDKVNRWK
ncbi:MAG: CXXX repeat peptide maturase [Bacteroidales bacterium]|jgi:CXXX repeat peptide maturase|nr:CXXX repeat peptide maturase [Bacteroidales bacterium]MDD2204602.1 CXXX repeat peptide maturase [Bacteroidales bacterium]MDD3151295.1 CXXX repeat peptide maturase [Bacteroidales bacterium]MDD3914367.1 CXXX repeat peptide maturase [Bacteroidales bacterium]MDD4633461.1 CXXX repeat peptide maturase [Bacteroidales bacterium]